MRNIRMGTNQGSSNGKRPLAIVTGASSGIGFYLAKECAENGYDLLIAADSPELEVAAEHLRGFGVNVETVETDLATVEGVDELYAAAGGRPIEILLANAGHGLGHAFLDQDFNEARHVIDTNVTGTIYLVHKIGREMRARGNGRILFTGSIAGFMPGTYQAVYNGTKAFVDSFSFALRAELKDSGVTVTCLMPGATDTEFFARADMLDTKVGAGKRRKGRVQSHDGRQRRHCHRLEEQDFDIHGSDHTFRSFSRATSQNGGTRRRKEISARSRR
jgi:short-subunit dehydrogenase